MLADIGEILFGFDVELAIHPSSLPRKSEPYNNPSVRDVKQFRKKRTPEPPRKAALTDFG